MKQLAASGAVNTIAWNQLITAAANAYDLPYAEAIYQEPVWVMVFESFWGVRDGKKWKNTCWSCTKFETGWQVPELNLEILECSQGLILGCFFQNLSSFGKFSITDKICVRTLLHFITFLYLPAEMQILCTTWLQNPKTASGDGTFEGDARCHRIQQPFECCSEKLGFAQMWVLLVAFQ